MTKSSRFFALSVPWRLQSIKFNGDKRDAKCAVDKAEFEYCHVNTSEDQYSDKKFNTNEVRS